jgi:spermidine synthase
MATLVGVLFFLSGFAALAYQLVWVRALGLLVGNSLWAAVSVVGAYMGGMAVGSALVAHWGHRLRQHARWYGAAEAVAALFALGTGPALALLTPLAAALGPAPLAGWGLPLAGRFAVAWLFLAVPTVALGVTLPVMVERAARTGLLQGRVAKLYAANTLGAMTGVVVTAYLALPTLGERGTLAAAATIGLAVALTAWLAEPRIPRAQVPPVRQPASWSPWLAWPALFGFVALAAELVWTRILLLHLGSRVYAFALILAVYLLGLSVGAAVARRLRGEPLRALALCQGMLALVMGGQVLLFAAFGDLLAALTVLLKPAAFAGLQGTLALGVVLLLLPATALFGAAFPLAVAAAPLAGSEAARAGAVSAANTAGAIAGAVAGPLLLVPWLGTQRALLGLAAVGAVAAAALGRRSSTTWLAATGGATLLAIAVLMPPVAVLKGAAMIAEGEVETISESASATVVVRRVHDARGTWRSLELNGVNVAGTSTELRAIQRLQGHLPLLLAPRPRRVLHIGFGSGGTAWAVSRHAEVEAIDIAEISPEVLAVSDSVFGDVNFGVLGDPRVRVIVNDGRNVLVAARQQWDAILSDSIHPVYAGNSALYTREYFQLCRRRLAEGGVVSMWLPMYSLTRESYLAILRAFWEVFPGTAVWYDPIVLNEFTVVTGVAQAAPVEVRWDALAQPGLGATLAEAGIHRPELLAGMLLLGPREVAWLVADEPPHVDDLPEVEYRSGRILARDLSWLENFQMLYTYRAKANPFAALPADWGEVAAHRDEVLRHQLRALGHRVRGGGTPLQAPMPPGT